QIKILVDGSLQRLYDLTYGFSDVSGRSILRSITQVDSQQQEALPAVGFEYQDNSAGYEVTTVTNDPVQGDNLWNRRFSGGYDRGHDNYGAMPPTGFDVTWGPTQTQASGDGWNIDGNGNLHFFSRKDSANWYWTYVYVNTARTLSVPYTTTGSLGVWLNGNHWPRETQNAEHTWSLKQGYNLIEITAYHQHENFNFDLNYGLADNVELMNSEQVMVPQLSGDFNGDGDTDIASFKTSEGIVEVWISQAGVFSPPQIWLNNVDEDAKLVLGDFDGDGLVDVGVFDSAAGEWRVAISDGSQFVDQGVWLSGFGAGDQPSSGDYDNDRLTDVMVFHKQSGQLHVKIALNEGGGFADSGEDIVIGAESDTPLSGDFNGDGLMDLGAFVRGSGRWKIFLNRGTGGTGFQSLAEINNFGIDHTPVVSDFNYDGLTDIGYYEASSGEIIYRISQGTSFSDVTESLGFAFSIEDSQAQIQAADYNGDTVTDFIIANLVGEMEIASSQGQAPDLLSVMDNGVGGMNNLEYISAGTSMNTFLPFPIQVLKSVKRSNSLGDEYETRYTYEQGLWDAQDREFRGFG
ncbi:MAG: hypothetical protein GY869_31870, partial [Planctomycetes bacterium]|nr:hypothetical protein [Planctomycetota bacterium]